MASPESTNNDFLKKLIEITEANLTNPQFGVSALAKEMGMSRVTLHRKVNAITKNTVSQFINQIRLKKAKEILRHTSDTVSEVAYKVGFNDVSYFIKCFHEYYGYSPGKIGIRDSEENISNKVLLSKKKKIGYIIGSVMLVVLLTVVVSSLIYSSHNRNKLEKTIAILPPSYDLKDSSYDHIVTGTIRKVIINLSGIKDINFVHPYLTSSLYDNPGKSAYEIAKELKVNYLGIPAVLDEGDQLHLIINLIRGSDGSQFESLPFVFDKEDATMIPQEISSEIARQINARITPGEKERLNKPITTNKKALHFYYQANSFFDQHSAEGYKRAIPFYKEALELDNKFALAYAELAISYFYLSDSLEDKNTSHLYKNAMMAYRLDPELEMSNKAMALLNGVNREKELVIEFLEKALDINPHSAWTYRMLSSMHGWFADMDTEKHLEYALKTIKYNVSEKDNLVLSEYYRRAARALRVCGLFEYAMEYIEIALDLNPEDKDLIQQKIEIIIDRNRDYDAAISMLRNALENDSTDFILNYNIFKNLYHTGNYTEAKKEYLRIQEVHEKYILSYLTTMTKDYARLACLYDQLGETIKYEQYLDLYRNIDTSALSSYWNTIYLIRLSCLEKDISTAIMHLKDFSQEKSFFGYTIMYFEYEPMFEALRQHPEFPGLMTQMKTRFEQDRDRIEKSLLAYNWLEKDLI